MVHVVSFRRVTAVDLRTIVDLLSDDVLGFEATHIGMKLVR